MYRGKTRKMRTKSLKKGQVSVLTIPELRKSLDHISQYADNLVKGGKNVKEMTLSFAKEWKKTFDKKLPTDAAESYIRHIIGMKRKSKKTRKYRGGAQSTELTGSPIDYMTRPGTDIPYGNFLKYVNSGFWNPEPAISYDCGKQTGVLPYPETGSNKMNGGGFLDVLLNRPIIATNPPSVNFDAQTAWKGQPLGPGPESWQRGYQYQLPPGSMPTPISVPGVYQRDLTQDVSTRR
jgi:hypothetical protein